MKLTTKDGRSIDFDPLDFPLESHPVAIYDTRFAGTIGIQIVAAIPTDYGWATKHVALHRSHAAETLDEAVVLVELWKAKRIRELKEQIEQTLSLNPLLVIP